MLRSFRVVCVLALIFHFALIDFQYTHAATKAWVGGGGGFWDDDDNWNPDEKPQPGDDALVGGNPEVNTLEISQDLTNTGTIDITTGALQPLGDMVENNGTINIGRSEGTSAATPARVRTRLEGTGVLENVVNDRGTFDIGVHAPGNGVDAGAPGNGSEFNFA